MLLYLYEKRTISNIVREYYRKRLLSKKYFNIFFSSFFLIIFIIMFVCGAFLYHNNYTMGKITLLFLCVDRLQEKKRILINGRDVYL